MKKKENKKENLKESLTECEKLRDEYLTGWQRAQADFINYKNQESERVGEIIKHAYTDLIFKILPILDNFYIAEKKISKELRKSNEEIKGLIQIATQLETFLKNIGLEEIKCLNEMFDPNFHEAIQEVEGDGESGIIVEEIQKGYKFNNKVLRPSKVKILK